MNPDFIRLRTLVVQHESLLEEAMKTGQYKFLSSIEKLKLSYKQNIITFEFSALDFGNSIKNQYEYILENFDDEWTKTDATKRSITYTNLPGGNYTFRVRASNGDGIWNNEGLRLELKITPPFWKRKWFMFVSIKRE